MQQRLPSIPFIREAFESAGLSLVAEGTVMQELASDYAEFAEKTSLRAGSILVSLTDQEFALGINAIRAKAALVRSPVTEPIDFFVFRA
jgi:hypothetical protein